MAAEKQDEVIEGHIVGDGKLCAKQKDNNNNFSERKQHGEFIEDEGFRQNIIDKVAQ